MGDRLDRVLDLEIINLMVSKSSISDPKSPGACSSARLERTPDKREVDGSIPSRPTKNPACAGKFESRISKFESIPFFSDFEI